MLKKLLNWKVISGIILVLLSVGFYFLHYILFHDPHHIFIYLVGDIAFVFIEVLMVSLIIHSVLNEWEKKSHLKKLHIVIEVFFSEFGKHFLAMLSKNDQNIGQLRSSLKTPKDCKNFDFKQANQCLAQIQSNIAVKQVDLVQMVEFLRSKREFLLRMLQNPNLLEHQGFTETLMAVFHVAEELLARNMDTISEEDYQHIKIDFERAYNKLRHQWLDYMKYTYNHYPYFFLYAMRTNPFN